MRPEDLQCFNQAVAMAQTGQKTAAYQLLLKLNQTYPDNANLLLWLAFTSASLAEARTLINKAAWLEPNNIAIPGAKDWLMQAESQNQTAVTSQITTPNRVNTNTFSTNATFTPDRRITTPTRPPKLGYQYQSRTQQQRIAYRAEQPDFSERFKLGWQFMKQVVKMAREDSNLLRPSFYSIVFNVLVSLVLTIPLFLIYIRNGNIAIIYLALFLVLLANYFVTYFFSAITIHLVHQHLTIGTSNMSLAWAVVRRSTGGILVVAAVSALIDAFRRTLSENNPNVLGILGGMVARTIETIWTTATFFILPAIVIEDLETGAAVKRATYIIKHNLLQVGVSYVSLSILGVLIKLTGGLLGLGLGAIVFYGLIKVNLFLALLLALVVTVIMLAIGSALKSYLQIAYYTCLFSWAIAVERQGVYAPAPAPLRVTLQNRAYAV
jgi:hypothetical protein